MYDERFERALKVGGRLFAVVGSGTVMEAFKVVRTEANKFTREPLFETVIEPMVNAIRPSSFVF